jgi:hypothetical protein
MQAVKLLPPLQLFALHGTDSMRVVEVSAVDYQSATIRALTETGDNPMK